MLFDWFGRRKDIVSPPAMQEYLASAEPPPIPATRIISAREIRQAYADLPDLGTMRISEIAFRLVGYFIENGYINRPLTPYEDIIPAMIALCEDLQVEAPANTKEFLYEFGLLRKMVRKHRPTSISGRSFDAYRLRFKVRGLEPPIRPTFYYINELPAKPRVSPRPSRPSLQLVSHVATQQTQDQQIPSPKRRKPQRKAA